MTGQSFPGVPPHLLAQPIRVRIYEEGVGERIIPAADFFRENAADNADLFPDIVAALLAGETFRDGGGAGIEWSFRLADRVRWDGQAWVPDHAAGCRADIAYGLATVLADARAAFAHAVPGDVDGIVETIRRQVASCLGPAAVHNIERRTELLVGMIDYADLQNEAERIAGWVHPDMLPAAARFAVAPLRGRF